VWFGKRIGGNVDAVRKIADINLVRIKDKKKQESDVFDSTSFRRAQQISFNFELFEKRVLSVKLSVQVLLADVILLKSTNEKKVSLKQRNRVKETFEWWLTVEIKHLDIPDFYYSGEIVATRPAISELFILQQWYSQQYKLVSIV